MFFRIDQQDRKRVFTRRKHPGEVMPVRSDKTFFHPAGFAPVHENDGGTPRLLQEKDYVLSAPTLGNLYRPAVPCLPFIDLGPAPPESPLVVECRFRRIFSVTCLVHRPRKVDAQAVLLRIVERKLPNAVQRQGLSRPGQQADQGLAGLLGLAALISINLGILNLLPIPVKS